MNLFRGDKYLLNPTCNNYLLPLKIFFMHLNSACFKMTYIILIIKLQVFFISQTLSN